MHDPIGRGPMDEMDDMDGTPDALIASVARELRRPVTVGEGDFTARLMAEVAREPRRGAGAPTPTREGGTRVLDFVLRPRTLRVSPLVGLAAAAALVVVALQVAPRKERVVYRDRVVAASPAAAGAPNARLTAEDRGPTAGAVVSIDTAEFVLQAPGATSVAVAGEFNDWNPTVTPLARRDGGLWVARVPLPAGRYEYTFVVDGAKWMPDPAAPRAPAGDFGSSNSVLVVGGSH